MRFKVFAFCTITLTFLLSCNRNLVNLDFTNAKDEVAPLTNLVFRFDKTLIADSLINHWDSAKYISFEPAIPGKFRWEHGDELFFPPPFRSCRLLIIKHHSTVIFFSIVNMIISGMP